MNCWSLVGPFGGRMQTMTTLSASHGVATPDAFWKLILQGKDRVIAWVIPNSPEATEARLDAYLVSIQELEARTNEVFYEVPDDAKWEKPAVSWLVPRGCNKG